MKNILRYALFAVCGLLLTLPAQAKDYEYDFDYGTLLNVGVNKNLTSRLAMTVEGDLWLNDNFTGYERALASVWFNYTLVPKYLKATVYGYYFNQEGKTGKKDTHRYRYQVGLTGSYATQHLSFAFTSRFEQTYTRGAAAPNNKWRNRLRVIGTISKEIPWKPFVSVEIFESMNGMNATGTRGMERVRYEVGTNYVISKLITLEMKLRAERQTAKKVLWSSVGLGLKINL